MYFQKLKDLYRFLTHEDELFVYASSLSFYTIFGFIPLLLIVCSILLLLPEFRIAFEEIKGFMLSNLLPTHSEVVAQFLDPLLSDSSEMGVLGFFYVLLTSVLFFRNYEYITAKVFGSCVRGLIPSLVLCAVLSLLFPLFFGVAFYAMLEFQSFWHNDLLSSFSLKFFPFLVAWGVFALLFRVSANKKLSFKALVSSSFFSSLGWSIAKWVFVYYATYNRSYNTIYGSVSFVLFAMLWIYLSWFIVLLGMRICEGMNQK